jgi:REP element-mobilizing transposase RayT
MELVVFASDGASDSCRLIKWGRAQCAPSREIRIGCSHGVTSPRFFCPIPVACAPDESETPIMHSYVSSLLHIVFATKDRTPWITADIANRLWPYLGGVARESNMKALQIGGVEDHVHALVSMPSTLSIAKALQVLKGNSSKWIHDTFPHLRCFTWQEGYGAFSIGISGIENTIAYIQNQPSHHQRVTFQQEFESILRKHGMEFEEWMAR